MQQNHPWAEHMPSHNEDMHTFPAPRREVIYDSTDGLCVKTRQTPPLSPNPVNSDAFIGRAFGSVHQGSLSPPNTYRQLRRPIAIPQVLSGVGNSICRAYPLELAERGISMDLFLEFLDCYNVASSLSPPLQVIGVAAGGLQLAVNVGNIALAKTRGSSFLKRANEELFGPRGLKAEVLTGTALKLRLGISSESRTALPVRLDPGMSLAERQIARLEGRTSLLTFHVPPSSEQTNMLDRLAAGTQKRKVAKEETKERKAQEKYLESLGGWNGSEIGPETSSQQCIMDLRDSRIEEVNQEAGEKRVERPEDGAKIERRRAKAVEKIMRDAEHDVKRSRRNEGKQKATKHEQNADKKEDKWSWLVIEDTRVPR